jgi:hypothetical protein
MTTMGRTEEGAGFLDFFSANVGSAGCKCRRCYRVRSRLSEHWSGCLGGRVRPRVGAVYHRGLRLRRRGAARSSMRRRSQQYHPSLEQCAKSPLTAAATRASSPLKSAAATLARYLSRVLRYSIFGKRGISGMPVTVISVSNVVDSFHVRATLRLPAKDGAREARVIHVG